MRLFLKKYKGTDPHVVIPDGVTRLDWHCFDIPIESITIPETLTSVDSSSFCDAVPLLQMVTASAKLAVIWLIILETQKSFRYLKALKQLLFVRSPEIKL